MDANEAAAEFNVGAGGVGTKNAFGTSGLGSMFAAHAGPEPGSLAWQDAMAAKHRAKRKRRVVISEKPSS
jgi:hypothetical protein